METEKIEASENDHLINKLAYYLNYELSATVLYFLSFMYGFVIFLAVLAALIFTPFLIYVLYKTKKFGWLTTFFSAIILPPIIFITAGINSLYLTIFLFVQLGLFYFYCFVLRLVVYDWTEKIKWSAVLITQIRKAKLEKLMFMRKLEKKRDY